MVDMIKSDKLYAFSGGLKLKHHKNTSLSHGLSRLPTPKLLRISLILNRGKTALPLVTIGESILKGQVIAKQETDQGCFIHASASGIVSDIDNNSYIEITSDGKDKWVDSVNDFSSPDLIYNLDSNAILKAIQNAGLVGLGGAGFPSHLKYQGRTIETLIINGAECEPYITCDEQLMMVYPNDLIDGAQLLIKATNAKQCVFAIEDQVGGIKTQLEKIIQQRQIKDIIVIKVPTIYPAGGEKQLIKVLTGKEVPTGGLPNDLGIIVQNVGTIKALSDYISQAKPLVERIVTVAGDCVHTAQNYIVPIGSPIQDILIAAGCDFDQIDRLIIGGPMMGYSMPNTEIGIDKTCNCILALSIEMTQHHGDTLPCIRCGECVNVCPANLLPQQLHWYINGGHLEKAREHHVFDCIECGACAWVCPSQIKLVDYYRYAKSELKYLDFKRDKADLAQEKFEQREARLLQQKQDRINKRKNNKKRRKDPDKLKRDLEAVMNRVNMQKSTVETKDSGNKE